MLELKIPEDKKSSSVSQEIESKRLFFVNKFNRKHAWLVKHLQASLEF